MSKDLMDLFIISFIILKGIDFANIDNLCKDSSKLGKVFIKT